MGLPPDVQQLSAHEVREKIREATSSARLQVQRTRICVLTLDVASLIFSRTSCADSCCSVVSMPGTSNDVQDQLVAIMQRQDSLDKFRIMIQQENAAEVLS